jgi:hypothetical protein
LLLLLRLLLLVMFRLLLLRLWCHAHRPKLLCLLQGINLLMQSSSGYTAKMPCGLAILLTSRPPSTLKGQNPP